MSLLEAISPTARQLLLGCQGGVSKSEHHRVHAERADGGRESAHGASLRTSAALLNSAPGSVVAALETADATVPKHSAM